MVANPEFAGVDFDYEGVGGSAGYALCHVEGWGPSFSFIGREGKVQFSALLFRAIPHEGNTAIGEPGQMARRRGSVDGGRLSRGPRLTAVGGKGFPEELTGGADEHPHAAIF